MSDTNVSGQPLDHENKGSGLYELLTAYIDGEIRDGQELLQIEEKLQSDPNFYNRYIFEKLTKQRLQNAYKKQAPPVYLQKKIGEDIDSYIRSASAKHGTGLSKHSPDPDLQKNIYSEPQTHLKRNLFIGFGIFVLLLVSLLSFQDFFKSSAGEDVANEVNPNLQPNDLVAVSRDIFDKITNGQVPVQIKSSNAQLLADSMNKYLDFKVFIPDVKDAELVGGTCNSMYGEKLAHIIHRKGSIVIYTLQGRKDNVMQSKSSIVLCKDFNEKVKNGVNWFTCLKDKNAAAVIWYRDNVICSSVAPLDSREITSILTNFK